jgi:hypothetical protein
MDDAVRDAIAAAVRRLCRVQPRDARALLAGIDIAETMTDLVRVLSWMRRRQELAHAPWGRWRLTGKAPIEIADPAPRTSSTPPRRPPQQQLRPLAPATRPAILAVLNARPAGEAMPARAIAQAAPQVQLGTVLAELSRMVAEGVLVRPARGRYALTVQPAPTPIVSPSTERAAPDATARVAEVRALLERACALLEGLA